MDHAIYGRTLMGDSLGFHIIFALLGVGIPLLISLAELLGILKKDNQYYTMARRWSFAFGTLFVVGAISGMIISNQMSILWPKFMTIAGQVIGPAFYMEGFAFFVEAIFLGIYLYSWDRFANKWIHWLCSLPLVIASATSAFFITSANAWMNSPEGFTYTNGVVSDVHPVTAIFNHATYTETTHSIVSYYLTTALFFIAIHAYFLWKAKNPKRANESGIQNKITYYKKVIMFCTWISLIFVMLVSMTGDTSARYVANYEPLKFAAAENLTKTTAHAPLIVGGVFTNRDGDRDHDDVAYSVKIPGALSILAHGDKDAVVTGLDAFDPHTWPPLWVHYMFDFMIFIGIFITVVVLAFIALYFYRKEYAFSRPMLVLLGLNGLSGFFAVEFGWILTEVGRQPYAIKGILTSTEAFTTAPGVAIFGFIFPTLYMILFIMTPWILNRHYKKHPIDLEKDYFNTSTI